MTSRTSTIVAAIVLVVCVVLVYGHTVNHQFLNWDDYENITDNAYFNPVTLKNIGRFWDRPFWGLYIPATYTLFGIESYLATVEEPLGPLIKPALFHAVSVALHAICVLLVFLILRRVTGHTWGSCAGALLFALHPVQVESVCWVTEQRGMLSHTFGLTAALVYLRLCCAVGSDGLAPGWARASYPAGAAGTAQPEASPRQARGILFIYALATLLFVLALLSKPSAVSIPLMLLVLAWALGSPLKRHLMLLGPWIAVAVAISVISKFAQSNEHIRYVTPWLMRPFVAGDALAFYLYKLLVPFNFGPDYGRTPQYVLGQWWGYMTWIPAALLLLAAAALARRLRHRDSGAVILTAIALFLVALAPVLGLVPFNFQDRSTVADRYLYLGMLGPALALAHWLGGLNPGGSGPGTQAAGSARTRLSLAVLLLFGLLSFQQSRCWKDHDAFYAQALKVNPAASMGHNNLGTHYLDQGRVDEAIELFHTAHLLAPWSAEPINNLVGALLQKERVAEAEPYARLAFEFDDGRARAYVNMGLIHAHYGRVDDAIQAQREAIRLEPTSARAYNNLGADLMTKGQTEKALRAFEQAVRNDPRHAIARRNFGLALRNAGYLQDALQQVITSEYIQANDPLTSEALASIYARLGRYPEAIQAIQLTFSLNPGRTEFLAPALQACRRGEPYSGWR